MSDNDIGKFFRGGLKHGTIGACFWQVATDSDAMHGDHEAYVRRVVGLLIEAVEEKQKERYDDLLHPCLTILTHKSISPPMMPGVQEQMAEKIKAALQTERKPT